MLEHLLQQYGYWFVYFGTLVEADATVITATFLARRGYLQIPLVLTVAGASTITVSQIWFWLARKRGQTLLERMSARHKRYARVRRWVETNGYVLVFFSRFLWGLRLAIPAACGATGMKAGRFAIIDAAGAVLWAGIVGTVGYAIAHAISRAWGNIRKHEDAIALGLLAVVSLIAMWRGRGAKGELKTLRTPGKLGIEAVSHVARGAGRPGRILRLHLTTYPPPSEASPPPEAT
jgi:membrane protein DedA with SNARE-associated domain